MGPSLEEKLCTYFAQCPEITEVRTRSERQLFIRIASDEIVDILALLLGDGDNDTP